MEYKYNSVDVYYFNNIVRRMIMQKDEWYNIVRTTDPETSKSAAKSVAPKLKKAKDRVLEIIYNASEIIGVTDEDISDKDYVTTSKYRTARVWLERQGYIRTVSTRKSRYGKMQRVWVVTNIGKSHYINNIKEN